MMKNQSPIASQKQVNIDKRKTALIRRAIFGVVSVFLLLAVGANMSGCSDDFTDPDDMPDTNNNPVAPGESADVEGVFSLMNLNSGKLLASVHFPDDEEGINTITQWGANNFVDRSQRWELKKVENGHRIINTLTGKDLSINSADNNIGSLIIETEYTGSDDQHWSIINVEEDYYKIVNLASGRVVDVKDGLCTESTLIQQVNYSDRDSRHWKLNTPGVDGSANGQLSWKWVSTDVPTDAMARITAAMNTAVARYNKGNKWPARELTVRYDPAVPTANANLNGRINFGADPGNQDEQTALHEIAHTYGVGLSAGWRALQDGNGKLTGEYSTNLYKIYEGDDQLISYGGSHFWLYNLNFQREYSEENARRHVEMIAALGVDGM